MGTESAEANDPTERQVPALRLSPNHRPASTGGMACGQETHPDPAEIARPPSSSDQKEDHLPRSLDGAASEGGVQGACLDMGLHL